MKKLSLKKWHKIVLSIILFFAVILFAVPRIGKWYLVKHSKELIGRNLAIDKIRLNYLTGTLRINDLKLFESDGLTPFVSFKKLKVSIKYLPLLKNEFHVKYINLDEPYVEVMQKGEKFNFSDMMTSSDTAAVKKDTVPSAPTKYIINNIAIARGYVKYTDLDLKHTIAMKNFDLKIPGFTWNADSTNLNFDFRFVDGGLLHSHLSVNQADSTYAINVKLDSLNLDIIEPYVKSYMSISAMHGFLTDDITIKGSMTSFMKLFVTGMNHVYGLQLVDTLQRTIFSAKDLAVDIDTIQLDKNRYAIKSVGLTDPFIYFEMIDTTNNWLALIKPTPPDTTKHAADTSKTAETTYSYTIPKMTITGGKVQIADKTLRYPFTYIIDNINLESDQAPKNPGKLTIKMTAGLNGTGNFSANALVDPKDFENLNISMAIEEFRMIDLDAYFKNYFGFPVTGGIMNFKTADQLKPKYLLSNNSIFFRKFTLAPRMDKQAKYKVPLRLALGILSDKDGIIDLKAPVESKGDDMKVKNLGKIVFKIIGNLFVKAAASPFNALAGSFKANPEDLKEIRLELTEASPDVKNMKSVDVIADILGQKPGLNVDFYYCIDKEKASDSLAYLLSRRDYINYSRSIGNPARNVADSTLAKYLLGKPSMTSQKADMQLQALCRAYIGNAKLNTTLDSLKNLQTDFMSDYLTKDKQLDATRFRIIAIAPDTIKAGGNYPAFRTYFNAGGGE
ncbi:MAG: DUF748 domain-containing protein [Bacteroidales bacterium]